MPKPRSSVLLEPYKGFNIWRHKDDAIYYVEGWAYQEYYKIDKVKEAIDNHLYKIKNERFNRELKNVIKSK